MRELTTDDRQGLLAYLSTTPLALEPRFLGALLAMARGLTTAQTEALTQARTERAAVGAGAGVAVIPILGPISRRDSFMSMLFGGTSVDAIRAAFRAALADPMVGSIAFVVDSPGGETSGLADLAAEIRAARGKKPMVSIADDAMYSAAYWIASAADRVVLTSSAGVGSIGVLSVHADLSGMYEQMGAKITVVRSGAKKAQFNSMEPLTAGARADLEAEVQRLAGLFFSDVAAARADLSAADIRAMEGGTFSGKAAVTAGLADAISTTEAALSALHRSTTSPRAPRAQEDHPMADEPTTPPAPAAAPAPVSNVVDINSVTAKATAAENARQRAIRNIFAAASFGATADQRKQLEAKLTALLDGGATLEAASDELVTLRAAFQSADPIDPTQPARSAVTDRPAPPAMRSREAMLAAQNTALAQAMAHGK
jgi:signal peptide peptidase SppA